MSSGEIVHGDTSPKLLHFPHRNQSAEWTVDANRRLVVVRFGKKVTVTEIERYVRLLRANPAFQPNFSEIADLTEVETLNLQASEFLRLADQIDPFSREAKRAFVVRTAIQAHAARMHKVLRTHRSFEIFNSFREAEHWLNS